MFDSFISPRCHYLPLFWRQQISTSAGDNLFVTGSLDKSVKVWDAITRSTVAVFLTNNAVHAVAFSPKAPIVLSGGEDRNIQLWHVAQKRLVGSIASPIAPVHSLAFSPSGRYFLAGCASGVALLAGVPEATGPAAQQPAPGPMENEFAPEWKVIRDHASDVRAVAWSPQGDCFLTASDDCSIKLYGLAPDATQLLRTQLLRTFETHRGSV
jgi:WD40 repeat protein